jgi:hypothetical protein
MDKENLDMKMPESEKEIRELVRGRAKILREWHRELSHLIDGFRNEMVEF